MRKEKQLYVSPDTKVICVKMEHVIAGSLGLGDNGKGSEDLEGRNDGGNWGDGGWY